MANRRTGKVASIGVTSLSGEQFTFNFLIDGISATNLAVQATLRGDTWVIDVNQTETYEVPLAAIEGG
jgi:hypothetical protein